MLSQIHDAKTIERNNSDFEGRQVVKPVCCRLLLFYGRGGPCKSSHELLFFSEENCQMVEEIVCSPVQHDHPKFVCFVL